MAEIEPKSTAKDVKKRMVRALFSYTPDSRSDELHLKKGDVLEVLEETEEGWWKGVLNGNIGMFPSNFVIQMDPFPEELNNKSMNELSPTKNVNEAKHLTQQEESLNTSLGENGSQKVSTSDLNVNNKKSVTTGKSVVDGSSLAKIVNPDDKKEIPAKKSGSVLTESSAPQLPPKPIREQARVTFHYTAQNKDELTLKEEDIVVIISKETEDKGWWKGELNGKIGVFPDNFVELIKVEEQRKPERPDKPVTAATFKANIRVNASGKQSADCAPRHDKKLSKTPPAKPPYPEIKKRDEKPDRPAPPFVSKKPQLPLSMKKPIRPSVAVPIAHNISNQTFTQTIAHSTSSQTLSPVKNQTLGHISDTLENKSDVPIIKTKKTDATVNCEEKQSKSDSLGFDAVPSSNDKLVHLTATRAKAPNRRPPSHIFLKEPEKENVETTARRRSEPSIGDVNSLFSKEVELQKASLVSTSETMSKISTQLDALQPSQPIASKPPLSVASLSTSKSVISDTSHIVIKSETVMKKSVFEEDSKKAKVMDHIVILPKTDFLPDISCESSRSSSDVQALKNELNQLKTSIDIVKELMVSRYEFNELQQHVNKMEHTIETYKDNLNQLKDELEMERKLRKSAELELERIKRHIDLV